ncbi:MAG: hypothetical protein K1X89_06400 [Myxococcaceae bacterium]|nr:hypothetical protein [Myxococcaceae bacterium]
MRTFALIGLVLTACQGRGGPAPARVTADAGAADAGAVLTRERVDAFLQYERALLKRRAGDAGVLGVREQALADARSREALGLTEGELDALESAAAAIATARLVEAAHQGPSLDTLLPQFTLDGGGPSRVDAGARTSPALEAARARLGREAFALVESRADELTAVWCQLLGVPCPAPPRP